MSDTAAEISAHPKKRVKAASKSRHAEPAFTLPSRAEAENDPVAFYRLVGFLQARRTNRLQSKQIAEALGVDKGTVSRKLNGTSFTKDERMLILDYIYRRRLIYGSWIGQVRSVPHNLFYSMMDFYDIKENSQDNARADIIGTYRLWRYSSDLESEYVLGKIEITEGKKHTGEGDDKDEPALCVTIRQVRKPREGQRETDEILDGYFLRVSNMYVMQVRQQLTHNLRCTIFKDFRSDTVGKRNSIYPPNTKHLVHLDGFAMGMDANLLFFSPVYVELVDDKNELVELDSTLDILPESKVPSRILQKLRRYPRIVR
jgi:transcriptional regulator with XRE-family HTH domain